jgi:hypothetical protein
VNDPVLNGFGHWIVEQRPYLVLDRLRAILRKEQRFCSDLRKRFSGSMSIPAGCRSTCG